MKNLIRTIIVLLTIVAALYSCRTPERLVEIAVKRNPDIFKDSVWVKEVKIPGQTIFVKSDGADSLVFSDDRINLKAFCKDNIPSVKFTIKDQVVPIKVPIKTFVPKKTRQENRLGTKEKIAETKAKAGVTVQEIKEKGKTARTAERQEGGKVWLPVLGLIIGVILGIILDAKILKLGKR